MGGHALKTQPSVTLRRTKKPPPGHTNASLGQLVFPFDAVPLLLLLPELELEAGDGTLLVADGGGKALGHAAKLQAFDSSR